MYLLLDELWKPDSHNDGKCSMELVQISGVGATSVPWRWLAKINVTEGCQSQKSCMSAVKHPVIPAGDKEVLVSIVVAYEYGLFLFT